MKRPKPPPEPPPPPDEPSEMLGDAPIEKAYISQMRFLARQLDHLFNGDLRGQDRPTGFILMVFPFGDEDKGRCNFISNGADRKDVVALMKEMIARFEGQPEVKGTA
jgi:hypothetical protein